MSKHRNYAFIIYPESTSLDTLIDFLNTNSIPSFISPLHDKDLDLKNNPKKPHYHILLNFPYPIEYSKVLDLFSPFNISFLTVIYSNLSYYRYLCHLDNPEKYQYDEREIKRCAGARFLQNGKDLCTAQKLEELMGVLSTQRIGELSELVSFLLMSKNEGLLDFVCRKAFLVDRIVTSTRYRNGLQKQSLSSKGA